jgi:hypothetical protein
MNLQQTIDELEEQAAKYAQAANSLRMLLDEGISLPSEDSAPTNTRQQSVKAPKDNAQTKGRKSGKKRVVSAETKAKLAASMKARHQQRREQQAQASQAE